MNIQWFQVLAGFGLFIFSLHFLENTFHAALNKGLRPWLNRILKSPVHMLGSGIGSSLLAQASSISIILGMGLINNNLISLEQGMIFMLGATLGTSLKTLVFAYQIHVYLGVVLILISLLIYPLTRSGSRRHIRIVLMAIGYSFIGLALLGQGLSPLWQSPALHTWFRIYDGTSLHSQLIYLSCGALLAMLVKSSTVVIFLVLEFALTGHLPFSVGAGLVLGSNLGTTLNPLLRAYQSEVMARRLAWGHVLIKLGGLFITLFCFNYFISWIDTLVPGEAMGTALPLHLVAVHIGFNFTNMLWWLVFLNFVLNFLAWVLPSSENNESVFLAPVVRRMIVNSPDRALDEVQHQLSQALNLTKRLTDECFGLLNQKKSLEADLIAEPNFELVKEGIYEVLLSLSQKNQISPEQKIQLQNYLLRLSDCHYLFQTSSLFRQHLEEGLESYHYMIPPKIAKFFERFQNEFNEVWLAILLHRNIYNAEELESILDTMEQGYFEYLHSADSDAAYHSWIYQILSFLRQETVLIYQMYHHVSH